MVSLSRAGVPVLLVPLLALPGVSIAHPGGRDKDGCHVCKTNCEAYGVTEGLRHCHDGSEEKKVRPPPKGEITKKEAYVDKVLDGDTLEVRAGSERMKVRILGIDCPESHWNSKCVRDVEGCAWQLSWGKAAAARAAKLLKHTKVTLECYGKCKAGRFDRPLRYVRLQDGRDFGLLMIKEAFCADYGWKYRHPRGAEYLEAQAGPKKAQKGMWQEARFGH